MHSLQSEIIHKLLVQPKINPEVEFQKKRGYAKRIC